MLNRVEGIKGVGGFPNLNNSKKVYFPLDLDPSLTQSVEVLLLSLEPKKRKQGGRNHTPKNRGNFRPMKKTSVHRHKARFVLSIFLHP